MLSNFLFSLIIHSAWRWLVLISLLISISRAVSGLFEHRPFSALDNKWRHWTATIAHVQLLIGMVLYLQSPLTKYFMRNTGEALRQVEITFFGLIHPLLMFMSVILITVGSSLAKRATADHAKFRLLLVWPGMSRP